MKIEPVKGTFMSNRLEVIIQPYFEDRKGEMYETNSSLIIFDGKPLGIATDSFIMFLVKKGILHIDWR